MCEDSILQNAKCRNFRYNSKIDTPSYARPPLQSNPDLRISADHFHTVLFEAPLRCACEPLLRFNMGQASSADENAPPIRRGRTTGFIRGASGIRAGIRVADRCCCCFRPSLDRALSLSLSLLLNVDILACLFPPTHYDICTLQLTISCDSERCNTRITFGASNPMTSLMRDVEL